MRTLQLKYSGVSLNNFNLKVTANGLFVEIPSTETLALKMGDVIEVDVDGKVMSLKVDSIDGGKAARIKIPEGAKEERVFSRAFSAWLRSMIGIWKRPPRTRILLEPLLWQDVAACIAALGLWFGLKALLQNSDNYDQREIYVEWMVRTVLIFAICWSIALIFRVWNYFKN